MSHLLPTGYDPIRHAVSDYAVGPYGDLFRVPTDVEGTRLRRTGIAHYVFAILAFTFTYLVISHTTSVLRDLDPARWLDHTLRWCAWAVAPELALVVITMIRPLRRVFGLFERLFLLTTNAWFILAAILLISRAG